MDPVFLSENIKPIFNLFLSLAEHFGLISAAAFILLSSRTLQRMISRELTTQDKIALILFFGAFGIFGTYDGDPINGVVANLRAISMIVAGLIGGPVVGLGAGIIAGAHRFLIDMDGFSSLPCALGTILEGTAAGLVSMRLKERALNWRVAAVLGLVGESLHMGLVLLMSRPFETALAVVKLIGIPMIVLNAVGAACLIKMIGIVVRNRERRESMQAQKALTIANQTVSHLRKGLNAASAQATARIIYDHTDVAAVAITNDEKVLAYIGVGDDQIQQFQPLRTQTTMKVIQTAKPAFIRSVWAEEALVPLAAIQSAIVVPLKKSGQVIGTLKFYGDEKHRLSHIDFRIAVGLSELFATQLELEDIQIKAQLMAEAEIKRLEMQINPHFLFNALNTITFYCRTHTNRARHLLLNLSTYLRRNFDDKREFITLEEELEQVRSYLTIAQARSGDCLDFELEIDEGVEACAIPPLIIQPLVENAVKHGLSAEKSDGRIMVRATRSAEELTIQIVDDGMGMSREAIDAVFNKNGAMLSDSRIGLYNVNQRLEQTYGPMSRIKIVSEPQKGTTITFRLPLNEPSLEEIDGSKRAESAPI